MRGAAHSLLSAVQANPSVAAGSVAFVVAMAMVAGNALYNQPGSHPVPLWATRDAQRQGAVRIIKDDTAFAARKELAREDQGSFDIPVPSLRPVLRDAGVAQAAPAQADEAARSAKGSQLVSDIQAALVRRGLYTGDIDGIAGPMTREAILAFERRARLRETGIASDQLLADLQSAPLEEPVRQAESEAQPSVRMIRTVPVVPVSVQQSEPVRNTAGQSSQSVAEAALVARIQIGLINFGETGVEVDGVMGSRTAAAIRAFEERYGLPVTGRPSEAIVRKMEQIGALKKS
jgi:peptidoglycan hydrolase-like protein with peptidoglycan-binding domain